MLDDVMCPISNTLVDRNVVRTNGLIMTGLLLTYVGTRSPFLIVPIGLDYVLRARMHGPASPSAWLARRLAAGLGLPYRPTDKAPKVFAARIGACFAMGGAIAHFVAPAVAPWLAGTLAVFAGLESIGDFCFGCYVYSYIVLPLYRARVAVKTIPLFRNLEDAMLIAIANGFQTVRVAEGTRLFTEGEAGDDLIMLVSGTVEIYHDDANGQRTVVATRGRGSVLGEMALLHGERRTASVRALTPLVVLNLSRSGFDAMLEKNTGMRELLERAARERTMAEGAHLLVGA